MILESKQKNFKAHYKLKRQLKQDLIPGAIYPYHGLLNAITLSSF